jgi:putative endonuclease
MKQTQWSRRRAGRGAFAERLAVEKVLALGMTVIGVNVRIGHLELDIVARDGDAVVVIEVRMRGKSAWQRPLDSIGPTKRKRLRRAATMLWDRRWSKISGVSRVRFDVIAVRLPPRGPPTIEHVRAAF